MTVAVPVPGTWADGDPLIAGGSHGFNAEIRDALRYLLGGQPFVDAFVTSAQTFGTSGSYFLVAFDTESEDSDSMHDPVTLNSRFIAPAAGLYTFNCGVGFVNGTTGSRFFNVRKNSAGSQAGGTSLGFSTLGVVASAGPRCLFGKDIRLAASDYIEVFAQQTSGGSLAGLAGTDATWAQLRRVRN